jgi:hypothetical protein
MSDRSSSMYANIVVAQVVKSLDSTDVVFGQRIMLQENDRSWHVVHIELRQQRRRTSDLTQMAAME